MSKILSFSYKEGVMIKEECPYYEELLKDDDNIARTPKIGSASCSYCTYHASIDNVENNVKCNADEFIPKPLVPSPIVYPINNNIFRKAVLRRIKQ